MATSSGPTVCSANRPAGTGPVFRAVAEYGDGWLPVGGSGLAESLSALRRACEERDRDPATVRVVPFGTIPSQGKLEHYRDLGVDEVVLRVPSGTAGAMLAVLDEHAGFLAPFGDDGDAPGAGGGDG